MNYDDERVKLVLNEQEKAKAQSNSVYDELLRQNQEQLQKQNSWQDEYQKQQSDLYDRSLALTQERLNQQKQQAEDSYNREAIASEYDYQKFINPYGIQSEQMANSNLLNSGVSETAKLGAYNISRNRTALARANADKAILEYNTQMNEAMLNNDTQKAKLAYELLQIKLANEMQAFQTATELTQNKLLSSQNLDNTYYGRLQDVFNQQNWEKEQEESRRRYEEQMAWEREQARLQQEQREREMAWQQEQARLQQQRWEKELAYQKEQDKIKNAQNWALINQKNTSNGISLTDSSNKSASSNNLSHISKEIINMFEGVYGNISMDTILKSIKTYYENGKITADEANYLLQYIGY